ncbi:MAG TPA: DUF72 domain-containing protein [Acidimicrobiales bacterium]|nr:DUF72 domain-containing protein [Acidimicrobiales bacterium]
MCEARVGTSGWSYPEWTGSFYPLGTSTSRMLPYYARQFPAVEAHGTYRRLPTASALERWCSQVPDGFQFAPKAHIGITHRRDLEGVEDRVADFVTTVATLGDRLGPVLFSLPHRHPDLERLDRLLGALPKDDPGLRWAFELGPAWVNDDVLSRLEAHDATLVLVDADGQRAPDLDVGPFTYLRLRRSRYDREELDAWSARLRETARAGRDVYAFFKHDEHGDGPRYARRVMGGLERSGR